MSNRRQYVARYRRARDRDAWLVDIVGIAGCQTHGRTLRQAGGRIEEALAAWLDRSVGEVEIEHHWPDEIAGLASDVADSREAAARASGDALKATSRAARRLDRMGLSRRDTAEILGISHQRVQQLLARKAPTGA